MSWSFQSLGMDAVIVEMKIDECLGGAGCPRAFTRVRFLGVPARLPAISPELHRAQR